MQDRLGNEVNWRIKGVGFAFLTVRSAVFAVGHCEAIPPSMMPKSGSRYESWDNPDDQNYFLTLELICATLSSAFISYGVPSLDQYVA